MSSMSDVELKKVADRAVLHAVRSGYGLCNNCLVKHLGRSGFTRNTVILAVQRLMLKKWVIKTEDGHYIPTTEGYRLDNKYMYGE